jgi:peptidoglycan/LPS O-acetylase OafA/YrhL
MERNYFYRPGLDALRFFSFLVVFVHHTPGLSRNGIWHIAKEPFAFGMQMFFLLSAYLITELLLREKEKTGVIHFSAFYLRRILRIWPLYFLGVSIALAAWRLYPHEFWLGKLRLLGYLFFFVNVVGAGYNPMNNLWSISIEEQFYLIWPAITRMHNRWLIPGLSIVFVPVAFYVLTTQSRLGDSLWFSTSVEFMFFGAGAGLALLLHRRSFRMPVIACAVSFGAGVALWFSTILLGGRASTLPLNLCVVYTLAGLGCILIFLAFLGLPEHLYPKPVLYLGTISYGLYVYHVLILMITDHLFSHWRIDTRLNAIVMDIVAFCITVAIAACSYHLIEVPFLRLKKRFTFISSHSPSWDKRSLHRSRANDVLADPFLWRPQGDSNPCYRRERAVS